MGNNDAGKTCPLCKIGKGVFLEIQNHFPDETGKKPTPFTAKTPIYIEPNKILPTQNIDKNAFKNAINCSADFLEIDG